jgi:hypothetical protein
MLLPEIKWLLHKEHYRIFQEQWKFVLFIKHYFRGNDNLSLVRTHEENLGLARRAETCSYVRR